MIRAVADSIGDLGMFAVDGGPGAGAWWTKLAAPEAPKIIKVFDVADGRSLKNGRQFVNMELSGKGAGLADGIRADVDGNIWTGAGCGFISAVPIPS